MSEPTRPATPVGPAGRAAAEPSIQASMIVGEWYRAQASADSHFPTIKMRAQLDLKNRIAAAIQAERERAETVRWILNKKRSTADVCHCHRCDATLAQAQADGWRCDLCGYSGAPLTLGCACYDHQCSGGRSAGSGCPHGGIACPACDDGDGDFSGWDVIRELRAALT